MKILLDYFFPVQVVLPTPQASTAFLKQACVVVKPKVGVTPNIPILCTTPAQVAAITDNVEAVQLFNAGMNRIYVLPVATLDLEAILATHGSNFFTLLISSDFTDANIAGVKASNDMNGIKYTAKVPGAAGNAITIVYVDSLTDGSATVAVLENTITVQIEAGETTSAIIFAALEASEAVLDLVDVELTNGSLEPPADPGQTLADGADAISLGAYQGVVGVSSTSNDFLIAQAAIVNRCAFKTNSINKAKNMFFAFGKLLSTQNNWSSQQYVQMPFNDGIEVLGAAELLFDSRVSFVITDDQYGNRLSMFACGGQAIVAPYIKKNLIIDMQSKALAYIAANQPLYTLTEAALIEDEVNQVVDDYIENKRWITEGKAEITMQNANWNLDAVIDVEDPGSIWRIFGILRSR